MLDKLPPEILELIFKHLGPLTMEVLKSVSPRLRATIEGFSFQGHIKEVSGHIKIPVDDVTDVKQISRMAGNKWLMLCNSRILVYDLLKDPKPKFFKSINFQRIDPKVATHGSMFVHLDIKEDFITVWDSQDYQNVANLEVPVDLTYDPYDLAMSKNWIVLMSDTSILMWRYQKNQG